MFEKVDLSDLLLKDAEIVFVDTETTGFDAKVERILEVSCLRFSLNEGKPRLLERFTTLINPQQWIDEEGEACLVNKIKNETVKGAPVWGAVAQDVNRLTRNRVVIGHHVKFDAGFIAAEQARVNLSSAVYAFLCTKNLSSRMRGELSAHPRSFRLGDLLDALNIDPVEEAKQHGVTLERAAHRAEYDAWGCYGLFMKEILPSLLDEECSIADAMYLSGFKAPLLPSFGSLAEG